MTRYVVLKAAARGGETPHFTIVEAVDARDSVAAIRSVVGDANGVYVAVPEWNWRPRLVEVQTERRVRVSDGAAT